MKNGIPIFQEGSGTGHMTLVRKFKFGEAIEIDPASSQV